MWLIAVVSGIFSSIYEYLYMNWIILVLKRGTYEKHNDDKYHIDDGDYDDDDEYHDDRKNKDHDHL